MRLSIHLFLLMISLQLRSGENTTLVNFNHLQHLTERIVFFGDTVSIVHIYSNYPEYRWVDAEESGPEGIACVDDAARAAVVYLRHYELTHNVNSIAEAKSLLKFIMKMETDDGMFYNFIFANHSINKEGKTSYKSFGWWASRGVWSMALGYRLMKGPYPEFASKLKSCIERTFPHIDSLAQSHGKSDMIGEFCVPKWLIFESAADATSELLLGLIDYYRATNDKKVKLFIHDLSDGFKLMQDGDIRTFPYGLHRSWQTMWHMWGNGQTQVLASASKLFKENGMNQSAEKEAKGWYSRLLIEGFIKEMDVSAPQQKIKYEQIAYGIRPMAVGLIRLYESKKDVKYLKMAGLAASWLFGNNVLHQQIYDPTTGRCFDGIKDSVTINKNSGAESTIEALYTIIELEQYPEVVKYLRYGRVKSGKTPRYTYAVFQGGEDGELTLAIDLTEQKVLLFEGRESSKFQLNIGTCH